MIKKAICPLCLHGKLDHRIRKHNLANRNDTHVYVCPECPFIGFEFIDRGNISDLYKLIK